MTGSHAFKVGFNRTHGYLEESNYNLNPAGYRFNNGVPNQITVARVPFRSITNLDNDLGLYAQDRWTLNRLDIDGAIRFDYFATASRNRPWGRRSSRRPGTYLPGAGQHLWKDLTYRSGLTYDLFGTGKTAVKVAFNKYLLGQTLNGLGRNPNPVLSLVTSANRSWNDRGGLGINGDYAPQCDLLNPLANGECGAIATTTSARRCRATLRPGPDRRLQQPADQLGTLAGVQHELAPRVVARRGYFRRAWATSRSPTTSAGAGRLHRSALRRRATRGCRTAAATRSTGFYDVDPDEVRPASGPQRAVRRLRHQIENWNGFDVTVDARLAERADAPGRLAPARRRKTTARSWRSCRRSTTRCSRGAEHHPRFPLVALRRSTATASRRS